MSFAWPPLFPSPKLSTYSTSNENAVLRTSMEGGPERQRRVFTQVPARYKTTFILNNREYETFRGFFKHSLNEGADYFTIELDLDTGLTVETVRFIEPYTAKKLSHLHWSVEGSIESAQPTVLNETLTGINVQFGIDGVEQLQEIASALTDLEILMAFLTNNP